MRIQKALRAGPRGRASATVALGIGLALAYVLVRGLLLVNLVPPWQGPDEPGHVEYALLLARDRRVPTHPELALERSILSSMARHDFYRLVGAEPPSGDPSGFADVERLGTDNTQVGNETPVGYLPHAAAAALAGVPATASLPDAELDAELVRKLLGMRLVNVFLVVVAVAGVAWAAAEILSPGLAPAAAWLAAAAPMLGFGGAIVNNDLTAAALAALWFGMLGRALRRGLTGRWIAALLAVAVAAGMAKRTALYLLPLLLLIAATALWKAMARRSPPRSRFGCARSGQKPIWIVLGIALVASLILLWPMPSRAAGWQRAGRPWGAERSADAARTGDWGLAIEDHEEREWQYLEQTVPTEDGGPIVASAWLRSDTPGTRGQLVVNDDRGTWLGETVTLGTEWQQVTIAGALARGARWERIAIVPGQGTAEGVGRLQADDLFLGWATRVEQAHHDFQQREAGGDSIGPADRGQALDRANLLENGAAESPLRLGTTMWAGLLRYTDARRLAGAALRAPRDPAGLAAEARRGLHFLFSSFWGGFGWLTIWPGRVYFATAALLTAFVVAAQALALLRPGALTTSRGSPLALRLCACAAVLAVVVAVVGLMAGASWERLPQGRYLIAALAPLAIPGIALADRLLPRWGPIALAAAAIAVDVTALALYIWPTYRAL